MKNIVFIDTKNWLSVFDFKTNSSVYASYDDGIKQPGFHIVIDDFINPVHSNKTSHDLTFYTGLENPTYFYKKMALSESSYIISPAFLEYNRHFCCPSIFYSGSALVDKKSIPKPNYQSQYLADLFVGRTCKHYDTGRAWSYYWVLANRWQTRLIFTARHRDDISNLNLDSIHPNAKKFILKGHETFGDIGAYALPNYDRYENQIWNHAKNQEMPVDALSQLLTVPKYQDFFIPTGVYKETLYSVLMTDCKEIYFDEKIARMVICLRPFIVIGPQGFLSRLRDLGFQTFDPVIDESYDQIENDHERWAQAFKSLENLSHQNPQSVYDRLRKRLQHNRKLAYNSEYWISKLKNYLNFIIEKHTGQKCVIY